MDDTTRSIIETVTTRYPSPRALPGGHSGSVFYDTAHLTPNDLARLAAAATGHLDTDAFDVVVGIAYAGIYFASAVAGGRNVAILQKDGKLWGAEIVGKKILLVSDIVCLGGELREAESKLKSSRTKVVGYACIVDRSEGKVGSSDKPLYAAYRTILE